MKTYLLKKVRRAPKTGLGKRKRSHTGCIYLSSQWYGQQVTVIEYRKYLELEKINRKNRLIIKKLKRMVL